MKKFLQIVLVFLCFSNEAYSATKKRSVKKTTTKSVNYATPTQDQCNIDIDYCFNRYCFDKKTLSEGVYSKCGAEPASTILINVEDCLATRAVIKNLNLQNGCKSYSYNRIISLLENKDAIEVGMKKNTKECAKATKALQAAKECYAAMISSDGSSSVELYNRLDKLCGFEASGDSYMLNRFYQAGDYGDSNVGALEDLRLSGQNTQKRENWRQVVDATLAGYTEIAELACGAEDYKLTKVNQYDLDSRENTKMIALEAEAKEMGKQTANRIVNHWFRETDCINSPLPVGGLYWDYKKGRSPDCMIVCKEGYVIGKNSSTCVKEVDDIQETYIGLNIGTDWVGANKKSQQKEEPTPTPTPVPSGRGVVVSDTCTKDGKTKQTWSPKAGIKGVCDVFFPNCHSRYYCRHTGADGEYFVTGSSRGSYDSWYDMKLSNDNGQDLNTIFKTSYSRFGDEYKDYLSADVKRECEKLCNGKVTEVKQGYSAGSITCNDVNSVMRNYSEGYVVEFGRYVKENADKFSSECRAINLGYLTSDNGTKMPITFASFPEWTRLYYEYTRKTMGREKSDGFIQNVRKSTYVAQNAALPLARAIKECVCKDGTQKNTGDCQLPSVPNSWNPEVVEKYISFLNSYTGSCPKGNEELWKRYRNFLSTSSNKYDLASYGLDIYDNLYYDMLQLRRCVCKNASKTSSETNSANGKSSKSSDDCPLPKANAYKDSVVLKYIDFLDNSYKGMCGNRSKYVHFEEYYAENRVGPAMDFKYLQNLDNEMIEFRKCVCSDKK